MIRRALEITAFLILISAVLVRADVVYSSIPRPLPGNVWSVGFEATSTSELGNAIQLAGTARYLTTIDVVMSDFAKASTYHQEGTAGFNQLLTLNLYNYGSGGSLGTLIGTSTVNAFIPWRPEVDPTCLSGAYRGPDGTCYGGLATTVTFDFTPLNVTLPDVLIFGLGFNTAHHGYTPTGSPGPYDSLNFGTQGGAVIGSNIFPNGLYLNSTWNDAYSDKGASGTGTFRLDPASWGGYSPEILINATTTRENGSLPAATVPEPASLGLLGGGLLAVLSTARRRMNKK